MKLFILIGLLAVSWTSTRDLVIANDSRLRYNYMEDRYEYTRPGETLRYNYMEDTYEYTCPEATLKYNYMEDSWEYAH